MAASTAEPSAAPTVTRHLRITGRVQGVGYRYHMAQEARRLCVVGWVRNRSDGTVEALAIGPLVKVETFVAWAHRGPENARVSRVEVFEAELERLTGFEQRPTV